MPEPTGTLYDTTGRLGDLFEDPQEEEPIQVDAGYDEDCCDEILRIYLSGFAPDDFDQETLDLLHNADCETLLSWIGSSADTYNFDPDHPDRTLRDAYNECVNAKTLHGGDFTMGDPMDLAWRLLKNA